MSIEGVNEIIRNHCIKLLKNLTFYRKRRRSAAIGFNFFAMAKLTSVYYAITNVMR